MKIPIEISARHVHLSREHVEKLFGKNYKLKKLKDLSQPGQFAAKEIVTLINGKNKIENVRILGPERSKTQAELSTTDARHLKLNLPLKLSGDIKNTPGMILKNTKNNKALKLTKGVMIAQRHLHCSLNQAKKLKIKNNQIVKIKVLGKRGLIFNRVSVRVSPLY